MKRGVIVFLTSLVVCKAEDVSGNAVTKVVNMLKDMKSKIEADDAKDEKTFNKFKCWCSKVDKVKTEDIATATTSIKKLTEAITAKEAELAAEEAQIKDINTKIKAVNDTQDKEKADYKKEHDAWMLKQGQQTQIIDALNKAVGILGSPPIFIQAESSAASAIKDVIKALPVDADISLAQLSLLQKVAEGNYKYVPQSLTVSGVLNDMKKNFGEGLDSAEKTAKKLTANHREIMKDLNGQYEVLKNQLVKVEAEKAESLTKIADDKELKADTEKQQKADEEFKKQTAEQCEARTAEYNERLKTRLTEMEGVNKAIEHLMKPENRALFARSAANTFIQINSESSAAQQAYSVLKEAGKQNSKLSYLATELYQELPNGGFTAVLKSIDEQMKALEEEGASDSKKKDYCIAEYQKINSEKNKRAFLIQKNEAKITTLETTIEERLQMKAAAAKAIKVQEEEMAEAKKLRDEQNKVFEAEKKDDEAASKLLVETRAMLAEYYEKGKGALIQQNPAEQAQNTKDLTREQQNFELTGTDSNKGAAQAVLGMIDHIVGELAKEIKTDTAEEAENKAAYEAAKAKSDATVEDLNKKITSLEEQVTKHNQDKTTETNTMGTNQEELKGQNEYEAGIKEECDWVIGKFDERYDRRDAEMESLRHAKGLLSGGINLLQTSSQLSDARLHF